MNHAIVLISCFVLSFLILAYGMSKILNYMEERKKDIRSYFFSHGQK